MFTQISLRGAPCFVRAEHVAAIRAARPNETGASTVVLVSGAELASPFDPAQLCARLSGETAPFENLPAPTSEQRAVLHGLYERLSTSA